MHGCKQPFCSCHRQRQVQRTNHLGNLVTLRDVLLVPNLQHNLISLSRADEAGMSYNGQHGALMLRHNGYKLLREQLTHKLSGVARRMELSPCTTTDATGAVMCMFLDWMEPQTTARHRCSGNLCSACVQPWPTMGHDHSRQQWIEIRCTNACYFPLYGFFCSHFSNLNT